MPFVVRENRVYDRSELSPFCPYTQEKVDEIGQVAAIRGTLQHIEHSLDKLKVDSKEKAQAEASRLRGLLRG